MRIHITVCALLVLLSLLVAGCSDDSSSGSSTSSSSKYDIADLNASVKTNAVAGTVDVTNQGSTSWSNTQICLNPPGGFTLDKGYTLKVGTIAPGETKTVTVSQFAKSDGTIFNPDTTKVLTVEVDTLDNQGLTTGMASFQTTQ
jgi:outer membrane lipoprotein-sorting protein